MGLFDYWNENAEWQKQRQAAGEPSGNLDVISSRLESVMTGKPFGKTDSDAKIASVANTSGFTRGENLPAEKDSRVDPRTSRTLAAAYPTAPQMTPANPSEMSHASDDLFPWLKTTSVNPVVARALAPRVGKARPLVATKTVETAAAPQTVTAPPAAPPKRYGFGANEDQDALRRAQTLDSLDRVTSNQGAWLGRAAGLISGNKGLEAPRSEPMNMASQLEQRRAGYLQDLELQQKQRADDVAQKQAAEEADPNSPINRAVGAFMAKKAPGMFPPGTTLATMRRVSPKLTEDIMTAATKSDEFKNQKDIEAMKEANALRLKQMEIDAERAKGSGKDPKPVPEQEATKIVNQAQSLPAIDELERLHKDVGPSAMLAPLGIHVGAEGRYHDAMNNLAGAVAAGALPAARETPGLMEEFKKGFPKGYNDDERARAAFDQLRNATKKNAEGQISVLRSGGYNPDQVRALQGQVDAAGSGGGGTVRMVAPDGSLHDVPADRVQDAKAAGGRVAG